MESQLATLINQGDVRFEYKHLIVKGAVSQRAAEAAECAGDQGMFWAYHDKLFANQGKQGAMGLEKLVGYAEDLGLNVSEFRTCIDQGKHAKTVAANVAEGQRLGVRSTPSFVLNGRLLQIQDLRDLDQLGALVKEELTK